MHLSHVVLALLLVLVWGFNFVAIKEALQEIPPLLLCFLRFFLTSIPAVFFIKFPAASWRKVVLYGLSMFALQFALLFMGIYAGVTPGLASLLVQTQVFFTIFLAVVFLDDHLHRWQLIGAAVAFCGIIFVGVKVGGSATFLGFLLIIASALSWSIGNLVSKKMGHVNMMALVIWGSLVAWPPLLVLSVVFEGPARILSSLQHLSWQSSGSVLYITYLSTLFGFGVWSWLLHHYRLPLIAPFTLLVPIIAMASSVIVMGEPLQSWKIGAAALVIAGLCINLMGPRLFTKKP
jgi:O-acetylserine/cysteine efflux transporter